MKNKLRSILTTTAATVATLVIGATSASAASLFEAILPYTPTEDNLNLPPVERGLEADGVNLIEYDVLPDLTNLDANYDSVDVMFLGESAGYKNTLQLSVNGVKTSIFDGIKAYDGDGAIQDHNGIRVGTFDSQYNGIYSDYLDVGTTWNSTDAGIGGFSQGDSLNFWLNPNGDATGALNMSMTASLGYGGLRSDIPLFKAYQLKGFEDWTIFAVEDIDYWLSPYVDHNDLVFAVRLNQEDVPEPSTIIGLLGVAGAGLVLRRKSLTK